MKVIKLSLWCLGAGAAIGLVASIFSGCAGAPTRIERALFNIETNREPVVAVQPVVSEQRVTNAAGVVSTVWETNRVWVTNWVEAYQMSPAVTAQVGSEVVGGVAGMFGPYGELATLAVSGGLAIWGWLRSRKLGRTAGVLAQVIETGREVLKRTPQGQAIDAEWTRWMTAHQAETGVIQNVMELLTKVVDNDTAKMVAEKLVAMLKERTAGG